MIHTTIQKLECIHYPKYVTCYKDSDLPVKARILYFHGGGLLYGNREDLPQGHIDFFTSHGYEILAFDYPLAPAADLELILKDVCDSVHWACSNCTSDGSSPEKELPYYLWGRSSGAYLCLIAAASGQLRKNPKGILSYYGYGFLCDDWFCTPNSYYRTFPPVDISCLKALPSKLHGTGPLETHYSAYVYGRQTGNWKQMIYKGREKFFYLNYSLRACSSLPCPVFAAHSTGDPDVPYSEFMELCNRYRALRFIAPGNIHDFDRDPDNPFTMQLLKASLAFLDT
jgi:acetyl esterase/lipase